MEMTAETATVVVSASARVPSAALYARVAAMRGLGRRPLQKRGYAADYDHDGPDPAQQGWSEVEEAFRMVQAVLEYLRPEGQQQDGQSQDHRHDQRPASGSHKKDGEAQRCHQRDYAYDYEGSILVHCAGEQGYYRGNGDEIKTQDRCARVDGASATPFGLKVFDMSQYVPFEGAPSDCVTAM